MTKSFHCYRELIKDGYKVLVGKSASENDKLTTTVAKDTDLWLHVNKFPGSHVVIVSDGEDIPNEVLLYAAELAKYYSKARDIDTVGVVYTRKINVIKTADMPAGQVRVEKRKLITIKKGKENDKT